MDEVVTGCEAAEAVYKEVDRLGLGAGVGVSSLVSDLFPGLVMSRDCSLCATLSSSASLSERTMAVSAVLLLGFLGRPRGLLGVAGDWAWDFAPAFMLAVGAFCDEGRS
jgi:hypothetical protein